MKKIIILFLFLFSPLIVNANANMYKDAYIKDNGDLHVKQAIVLYGNYNGAEIDVLSKYFGEYAIYSADSFELIRVCETGTTGFSILETPSNCFERVNNARVGDSRVYEYFDKGQSVGLRMYNPSTLGNKGFYFEYILKNVVVKHNDIAELRLNVLDTDFREFLNNFEVRVHIPDVDENLRIWGHGPLYGESKIENNKTGIFTITDLPQGTKVDIRMSFNKELIPNSAKLSNIDNFDNIIKEETELADRANEQREEYIREKEERNKRRELILFITFICSGIWFFGLIIYWIYIYKKYDKEHESDFDEKYYRDFPNEYSPETVQYLMKKNIDTVGLSSSLLNIIRKKGLTIEETTIKTGIIRKKEEKDYILKLNKETKEELTKEEEKLRKWFLNDFGDGEQFKLSSITSKIKNESSARKFMRNYNEWLDDVKSIAVNEDLYEDNSSKKVLPVLYSFIPIIFIILGNFIAILLLIPAFIFIVYIIMFKRRTKKGNEYFSKWNALKNFLDDFGNFSDRELPEIHLWEKYLVYANVFGLADKLQKQMDIKIKNINDVNTNFNTSVFGYLYLHYALNQSLNRSVNNAVTKANNEISRAASSSRSSGGGFGGGFSGGGGFGGGGGLSGGRF